MKLAEVNQVKLAIDTLFVENTIMKGFILDSGLWDQFCAWQIKYDKKFEEACNERKTNN